MRFSVVLALILGGMFLPPGLYAQSDFDSARAGFDRDMALLTERAEGLAAQIRPAGSYLGVRLLDIDADRASALKLPEDRGVEVAAVEGGSPADTAGIKPGDVLLSYNGENVVGAHQFIRLVQETPQGRKIKIQLWRDGKTQSAVVTTGAPRSPFELPPNFVGFNLPDMNALTIPDIPNPMLLWKNSLLGIECEPVDSQLAEYFGVKRGVLVRSVDRSSAAERAGMKAGDVLVAIGNQEIATPRDMNSYMRSEHQAGKPISLSLVRNRKPLTLNITPEAQQ